MKPVCELRSGVSVEECPEALTTKLEEHEEVNRRLKQELLQQQEITKQLAQGIQEEKTRIFDISVERDQAIAEWNTWAKTESCLRQKTEELARSNHALEQFASLAAHDLQEPLHSIQVFSDLLRVKHGASLDEQGQGYLERVNKAVSRMQQLIEGLLIYSRTKTSDSNGVSIDLSQIVKDILSDLGARIEEVHAEIHVGDFPEIHGDALQIRQLFQNLIANGLKFHKPGVAPVIHITAKIIQDRRHVGSGKTRPLCQIQIEDQGIGMASKYLDKIFGMFARLHRKDEYEGTGIGLAICQRIVDQCDGAISVQSTLGEGTNFTVTLPA